MSRQEVSHYNNHLKEILNQNERTIADSAYTNIFSVNEAQQRLKLQLSSKTD